MSLKPERHGDIFLDASQFGDPTKSSSYFFTQPLEEKIIWEIEELPELYAFLDKAWEQGKWLSGFISYDCALGELNLPSTPKRRSTFPLAWLATYQGPSPVDFPFTPQVTNLLNEKDFSFSLDQKTYIEKITQIKKHIELGETYQINFTHELSFPFQGDPWQLYLQSREAQPVSYGAFLSTQWGQILSLSPELFFKIENGVIETKPMKGTAARGRTNAEDQAVKKFLAADPKTLSENLMILDLHRNDLSRIATPGSVEVPKQFQIEKHPTLFQMTSEVRAQLKTDQPFSTIFKALFPSGSVTGAPKIRSMQIIEALEARNRGVYCGAIGFLAPEKKAVFNVPIRTLTAQGGNATMGIGGGVLFDSDAKSEYDETKLKAKFLTSRKRDFDLLETIAWKKDYLHLADHLNRLEKSAEYFDYAFDLGIIRKTLEKCSHEISEQLPIDKLRIRLLLSKNGNLKTEIHLLRSPRKPIVKLAPETIHSGDPFYFHKTTYRPLYDRYFQKALDENITDYLFLNEKEELTEGAIHNVFIRLQNAWWTPQISCGLLAGTARARHLLSQADMGEKKILLEDLKSSDHIFLCNAGSPRTEVNLHT